MRQVLLVSCAFACFAAVASETNAQVIEGLKQPPAYSRGRNEGVLERAHPELDQRWLALGAFRVVPQLAQTVTYTSNEKAADKDEQSDTIYRIAPVVSIRTDWTRHGLGGSLWLAQTRHAKFDEDNATEYGAGVFGRMDLQRDFTVDVVARGERIALAKTDPDLPGNTVETAYIDQTSITATTIRSLARIQYLAIFEYKNETYNDAEVIGGRTFNLSIRDKESLRYGVRTSLAATRDLAFFVSGLVEDTKRLPVRTFDVDSTAVRVTGGVNFDITRLVRGEIGLGYVNQEYDDARLQADSGALIAAEMQWFPSRLTTVSLRVDRNTLSANIADASGATVTTTQVTVDHELLRSVILSGTVISTKSEYSLLDRQNDDIAASAKAKYTLNRRVGLDVFYTYADLKSDGVDRRRAYTDHRLGLTLRVNP